MKLEFVSLENTRHRELWKPPPVMISKDGNELN